MFRQYDPSDVQISTSIIGNSTGNPRPRKIFGSTLSLVVKTSTEAMIPLNIACIATPKSEADAPHAKADVSMFPGK
jgi:hypothetical protein